MREVIFVLLRLVVFACMTRAHLQMAVAAEEHLAAPSSTKVDTLKSFLQDYLRVPRMVDDSTTRFSPAFVDLNGDDTQEVILYVTGEAWCGTGGCLTLILARMDSTYRVVTRLTVTRPPIRVLTGASNGWRNISVWVQGGGIQPGYEAELRFDGTTYPSNPSVPPARPLASKAAGRVVIASSQGGVPLYP